MVNERRETDGHLEPTNLAKGITATEEGAKLDLNAKLLLADKQVLSWILKYTLTECENMTLDEISESICDDIEVSSVPIEPGFARMKAEKVVGTSQESNIAGEGLIRYDIRFSIIIAAVPLKILINVEAQKSSNPSKLGYNIENRMLFYLARMISEEKEIEFVNSNYDDIKKVKSIWICMDSKSESITKYNLTPKVVLGDAEILDYDSLIEGIIVRIRNTDNHEKSKNNLIKMLEELFGNDNPQTKKRKLEEQGMVISKKVEGRLNTMCNYSELVMERGIEQGIKCGKYELIKNALKTITAEDIVKVFGVTMEDVENAKNYKFE